MTSLRITVLLLFVAAGCQTKSAKYCAANPDDPACGGTGSGTDSAGSDCNPTCDSSEICDLANNKCVACLTNDDCHMGDKPVCVDADGKGVNACHACRGGADCPDSDACLPNGSCAAPTDVAYVGGANAADTSDCSKATPCATVNRAMMAKTTVVIEGPINEKIMVNQPVLVLVGGTNGSLTRTTASEAPINVAGPTTNLTVFNLYIGGSGVTTPVSGFCVDQGDGTVTLDHVEIAFCTAGGVNVTKGTFISSRSTIHDNTTGAIAMAANTTRFDITNTFVFGNGSLTYAGAAVSLFGNTSQTNRFEFNTVAFNVNKLGVIAAAGVVCNDTYPLPNNILVHNISSNGTSSAETDATAVLCQTSASIINMSDVSTLHFVSDVMPYDLHIATGSMAVDKASSTSLDIDNKGTGRPQGNFPDIGADELVQ